MQSQQNDLCSLNGYSISEYVPTTNAKEAEVEQFYENLQDLLELTHTKKMAYLL